MNLRCNMIAILVMVLALAISGPAAAQDSATVRIRVDLDNVRLLIDSTEQAQDAYGHALTAEAWFIMQMPPGEYNFEFAHEDHPPIFRQESLVAGEVKTIDIDFIVDTLGEERGSVLVRSVPDSAEIWIDNLSQRPVSPTEFQLSSGQHIFELFREGFEPLSHELTLRPAQRVALDFKLSSLPPATITEESLNLFRIPMQILIDGTLADRQMTKYSSMAETFAVIPFGQGVMGKLLLDKEDQPTADALLISGAILSLGSYIIGKIISTKKRNWIDLENIRIERDNELAKENNRQIDITVRQANADAIRQWELDNLKTGKVKVTIEDE